MITKIHFITTSYYHSDLAFPSSSFLLYCTRSSRVKTNSNFPSHPHICTSWFVVTRYGRYQRLRSPRKRKFRRNLTSAFPLSVCLGFLEEISPRPLFERKSQPPLCYPCFLSVRPLAGLFIHRDKAAGDGGIVRFEFKIKEMGFVWKTKERI